MNLTPAMDPNAAPLDTLHKSRRTLVLIALCVLLFVGLGISDNFDAVMPVMCFVVAGGLILAYLFFDIQTVEFFPTYISLNYILRKRRIERADIDFVSLETRTTKDGGTYSYVQMKLRSGRKINFGTFKEGTDAVYQKLKACESTNEEFLQGR